MKRGAKILSLVTLIVVLSTSLCFAGTLNLEDTYPVDGSKGAAIENLSIKLYFDTPFTEDTVGTVNRNCFTLYGPEGEKLPTRVLYPEKEEGVVLVLLDTTVDYDKDGVADYMTAQQNSQYKLVVSGDLRDNEGNTLGESKTITFTTINQKLSTAMNMVMMMVMMGGMVIVSTRQAKKQMEEDRQKMKEDAFNPYKEAKKTGKSVQEVLAQHEKEEAKKAAKEARKHKNDDDDEYEWIDENTYRVARKRPISEGGSSYITGRKAIAEAKKAEEEARKAAKAAQKRNVKKGKGKKK